MAQQGRFSVADIEKAPDQPKSSGAFKPEDLQLIQEAAKTPGHPFFRVANALWDVWGAIPGVPGKRADFDNTVSSLPVIEGAIGGIVGGMTGGPVGAAIGAGLGGGAGESHRQLINRAIGRPAPSTPGQAATQIGTQAAINAGSEVAGGAIVRGGKRIGQQLMQSALKPGAHNLKDMMRGAEVPQVVKTLLDEGVNVTQGGLHKLQELLKTTNAQIRRALESTDATVNPRSVAARTAQTERRFRLQVNPESDVNAIKAAREEFLRHPSATEQGVTGTRTIQTGLLDHYGTPIARQEDVIGRVPAPMSVTAAQDLKTGTYETIGKKYGQLSSAEIEGQKALARGLKEEIERAVPQVRNMNQREGNLLEALEAVGNRVAFDYNRNPVGFAWVAATTPRNFVLALMDRSPIVKSLIARGLYQQAARAARVPPDVLRTALAAIVGSEDE